MKIAKFVFVGFTDSLIKIEWDEEFDFVPKAQDREKPLLFVGRDRLRCGRSRVGIDVLARSAFHYRRIYFDLASSNPDERSFAKLRKFCVPEVQPAGAIRPSVVTYEIETSIGCRC